MITKYGNIIITEDNIEIRDFEVSNQNADWLKKVAIDWAIKRLEEIAMYNNL